MKMKLSVNELGAVLSHRQVEPPHQTWDLKSRAMIVILWGLFIYPTLDSELKSVRRKKISLDNLLKLFDGYFESQEECLERLFVLKQHDYIRFTQSEEIVPGTQLFASVNAAKMYNWFRNAAGARQLFQIYKKTAP